MVGQDGNTEDEPVVDDKGVHFIWTSWRKTELTQSLRLKQSTAGPKLMYNRLEDNFHLSNKKALFMNMCHYYRKLNLNPFEVAIPLTFHIKSIHTDPEFKKFVQCFNTLKT